MRPSKLANAALSLALLTPAARILRPAAAGRAGSPVTTGAPPPSGWRSTALMTPVQAERFLGRLIAGENAFYQPGVSYDAATAVTYDGHAVDYVTGQLTGEPRRFSAASKESLHVGFLALALEGNPTALTLLAPKDKSDTKAHVLAVLEQKIATYERFDREYPGFGGFLPWYRVQEGRIVPERGWEKKVPGLDNGQLAWSLYLAAHVLDETGHNALAKRYRDRFDLMAKNVVRIFYDPELRALRAEAVLEEGTPLPPEKNRYSTQNPKFLLDDPYEGTLLAELAAAFGDWRTCPDGQAAIFSRPRRERATYRSPWGDVELTVDLGNWHSSHEQWAFGVLPYLDDPILRAVFDNTQKARTINAAELGEAGLGASVNALDAGHPDGRAPDLIYVAALGIRDQEIIKHPLDPRRIVTPYGAFPLGLVEGGRPAFASWLEATLARPGMTTPYGMAESWVSDTEVHTPLLTWDVKGLVALGEMGGFQDTMRRFMIEDGIYDAFRARVAHDRAAFDGRPIEGRPVSMRGPSLRTAER